MTLAQRKKPLAVITGSASGIGRSLAIKCATKGINVALLDINIEGAKKVENYLSNNYPLLLFKSYKCDVTDINNLKNVASSISNDFSGSVEYLFNNAGLIPIGNSLLTGNLNVLRKTMDVNLWGCIYGTQVFLPLLKKSNLARIINTASIAGIEFGEDMYYICKHSVVCYTEVLSRELYKMGLNNVITCHVLCPAFVTSNLWQSSLNILKNGKQKKFDPRTKFIKDNEITPQLCADIVFNAFDKGLFYIHTHPDWLEAVAKDRFEGILLGKRIKRKRSNKAYSKKVNRSKILNYKINSKL